MSEQDKAEGFEACRAAVMLVLCRRPVLREIDVRELGNPFVGARNAHEWLLCPRHCRVDHEPVKLVPGQRCPECRELALL